MNNGAALKKELDAYVKRTISIRQIGTSGCGSTGSGAGYSRRMRKNAADVAALKEENNKALTGYLYPLLDKDAVIDAAVFGVLEDFCDYLMNPWPLEELDLTLLYKVSKKLLDEALKGSDDDLMIKRSRVYVYACYNNMMRANRLRLKGGPAEGFQSEGLKAAGRVLAYLDKERFLTLNEDSRNKVLIMANFHTALYDRYDVADPGINGKRFSAMKRFLDICDDPFYMDNAPGFNRARQRIKCLESMGQLTENGNLWNIPRDTCVEIMDYMEELRRIWEADPIGNEEHMPRFHLELLLLRNGFYAGRLDKESYRRSIFGLYKKWENSKYDNYSAMINIMLPAEFLASMTTKELTEEIIITIGYFYDSISAYLMQCEGRGSYSSMLDYLCMFLDRFIPIPGEYKKEDILLGCLAALDPAEYVQNMQVATLSRCLAGHLGRKDVKEIYHKGLCYDTGRICMTDLLVCTGRDLLPEEEMLIKYTADRFIRYPEFDSDDAVINELLNEADMLERSGGKEIPALIEGILKDTRVRTDVEYILQKGKEDHYRNVFLKLRSMQENTVWDFDKRLKEIVQRTERIRTLSAPQIREIEASSGYGKLLKQHFREIGILAGENREILEKKLYPLLKEERSYTEEEAQTLSTFCDELMNGQNLSDFDQSLVYIMAGRLLADAEQKDDIDNYIKRLDIHISSCYEMAHQTKRMKTAPELIKRYREEGLQSARRMWEFIDRDRFLKLNEESRELVLINSRYAIFLYDTVFGDEEINNRFLETLEKAYELEHDSFYRENAPAYDWNYHTLRSLEYMGQSTECGNTRGFTKEQCIKICKWLEEYERLWKLDPENNADILPRPNVELLIIRNRYYAGLADIGEYRGKLLEIYRTYKSGRYDFDSVFPNLQVPLEYMLTFKGQGSLSKKEEDILYEIYRWIIVYVSSASNGGAYSLILEYFSELIYNFVEIPGRMDFMDMGLYSMAVLHPPTYIHSLLVGDLSRSICRYMLDKHPADFVGVCGFKDTASVKEHSSEIEEYCYNAAITHDFGKIPMIDTIFVYGRNLFDHEFELLKHHPLMGERLLSMHASTAKYADVAAGHHKWYNDMRGYPDTVSTKARPDKLLTDIVAVADSLDAATDTVGRSYTGGKIPSQILAEIQEGAGTRYSGVIAGCLKDKKLRMEIVKILTYVRGENYEKTYDFLLGIMDKTKEEKGSEVKKMQNGLLEMLDEQEKYLQAYRLVNFDIQTVCPKDGLSDAGDVAVLLSSAAYRIGKDEDFIKKAEALYENRQDLDERERVLAGELHRKYLREKNISAEKMQHYENTNRQAFVAWNSAREADDFSLFAESLKCRVKNETERVRLWDKDAAAEAHCDYDRMLDEYEPGINTEKLDRLFDNCKDRIAGLIRKKAASTEEIRTDFLSARVSDDAQAKMAEYLLDLMGFDKDKGCWSRSVHPFTDSIGKNDTRITTHFEPERFLSSIYSVIHECGHALFEQLSPPEDHDMHIAGYKTMGQHESVSRFYENVIGRSEAFVHLIYPKVCELFPEAMRDVSEKELYKAVNLVKPSLIRTDADELTYTFHIIIRYEIEKELIEKGLDVNSIPAVWADKYGEYLGVRPKDDLNGALQDVHWTDSFGYFPAYALGNFYNGMYLREMQKEFDPFESLLTDGFAKINEWMRRRVFAKADMLTSAEWIRSICGRELTAEDYLEYLEDKYG